MYATMPCPQIIRVTSPLVSFICAKKNDHMAHIGGGDAKEYFGWAHAPPSPSLGAAKNEEMATMAKERSNASFPSREMTYFLDGGAEQTQYYVRLRSTSFRR
jgi:hypothetical protein